MKYILISMLAFWLSPVFAIKWPSVTDPKIIKCEGGNACDFRVYYSHSGTQWIDVMPVVPPPSLIRNIAAFGVHCEYGSKLPGQGKSFSVCNWAPAPGHAPTAKNCTLKGNGKWELTDDSDCISDTGWGPHSGAGPGGECVLFGHRGSDYKNLQTPMGIINAQEAANSGNRFCQKPLPPDTRCDIQLSDTVIDHGVIVTNGTSDAVITGVIDCGKKPIVEIVNGGDYKLGPGLDGVLETILNDSGTIRIESHLTAVNAAAGDYSANKVITVSPW